MDKNLSKRNLLPVILTLGFLVGALVVNLPVHGSLQQAGLPEGDGVEIVKSSCLSCHGTHLITEQRLTREKWQGEVNKMINWGAAVDPADKDKLADYLANHFGYHSAKPPRNEGPLPDGAGKEIARDACLNCHGTELISQQRLTPAQWKGEVEKMVRWGATVPDDKKTALIEYLASSFPDKN
jgi:cytochrome c5